MRFPVDAQLPARLASRLAELGHDVVHTSSLPDGNRTTDQQIASFADQDGRIVITKDADFRNSHLLKGTPTRLLTVATGNIRNDELLKLFESHLAQIDEAFARAIMSSSREAPSCRIHARIPEVRVHRPPRRKRTPSHDAAGQTACDASLRHRHGHDFRA